jgi:hypothetical protein
LAWLFVAVSVTGASVLVQSTMYNPKEFTVDIPVPWKTMALPSKVAPTNLPYLLKAIRAKGIKAQTATPKLNLSARKLLQGQSYLAVSQGELVDPMANLILANPQGHVTLYWSPGAKGYFVLVFKGRAETDSDVQISSEDQIAVNSVKANSDAQLPILINSKTDQPNVYYAITLTVPKGEFGLRAVEVSKLQ